MLMTALSRVLIAATTTAVAAATLTAPPAIAASPNGVTRELVLAAVASLRSGQSPVGDTPATRALAQRACALDPDTELIGSINALPTEVGQSAEGLFTFVTYVDLTLFDEDDEDVDIEDVGRVCIFGAVGSVDPSSSLSGTATLDAFSPEVHPMSGGAFSTPPIVKTVRQFYDSDTASGPVLFSAAGQTTRTTTTTTTIVTPKTAQQKTAAKKAYSKAVKSAKKRYTTAVKKADGNKKKVRAAKKAYTKKKAAAKTRYTQAIATARTVRTTTMNSDGHPFSISVTLAVPEVED